MVLWCWLGLKPSQSSSALPYKIWQFYFCLKWCTRNPCLRGRSESCAFLFGPYLACVLICGAKFCRRALLISGNASHCVLLYFLRGRLSRDQATNAAHSSVFDSRIISPRRVATRVLLICMYMLQTSAVQDHVTFRLLVQVKPILVAFLALLYQVPTLLDGVPRTKVGVIESP